MFSDPFLLVRPVSSVWLSTRSSQKLPRELLTRSLSTDLCSILFFFSSFGLSVFPCSARLITARIKVHRIARAIRLSPFQSLHGGYSICPSYHDFLHSPEFFVQIFSIRNHFSTFCPQSVHDLSTSGRLCKAHTTKSLYSDVYAFTVDSRQFTVLLVCDSYLRDSGTGLFLMERFVEDFAW